MRFCGPSTSLSEITAHPLLSATGVVDSPEDFLRGIGHVFAIFNRQDSGNISFGIEVNRERFFVKTAGDPADPKPFLDHKARAELLRNAVRLAHALPNHPALIPLRHVIDNAPQGPLLIYDWVEGELLSVPRAERDNPTLAFARFRSLPFSDIASILDTIFVLHRDLAARGWIASDFYDGCLLYDFTTHHLHVMDLDTYHLGAFLNTMGRMFGSTRFMSPEEFQQGETIDERTTVFTLGRTAAVFLSDGTLERSAFRGSDVLHSVVTRACRSDKTERWQSVADFWVAWHDARKTDNG